MRALGGAGGKKKNKKRKTDGKNTLTGRVKVLQVAKRGTRGKGSPAIRASRVGARETRKSQKEFQKDASRRLEEKEKLQTFQGTDSEQGRQKKNGKGKIYREANLSHSNAGETIDHSARTPNKPTADQSITPP